MIPEPRIITTSQALLNFVAQGRQSESVALDTEFVWERTYYPQLGLIQAALDDSSCYLIDTVALDDVTPLGTLLHSAHLTVILHDAQQDLTILRRVTGAYPRKVFDTRCAAGLAGLSSTTSLAELVTSVIGVDLPKTESRTDWVRRPLTADQVQYAAEDVCYLHALRDELVHRVARLGRTAWLQEEMASLNEPCLYDERNPREQYLRLKGAGGANAREMAILRELAAWREEEARRLDRPRARVVADTVLLHLARHKPNTQQALKGIRGLARRYQEVVLELVHLGMNTPVAAPAGRRRRLGAAQRERMETQVRKAMDHVRTSAVNASIDPPYVATRAEIRALVTDGPEPDPQRHRVLRGWRREFVGEALLTIVRDLGRHCATA